MPIFQKYVIKKHLENLEVLQDLFNQTNQISTTDTEIDKTVYGLSDREIAIVESSN